MGLFYLYYTKKRLVGYADVGYLSDTDTTKSQIGYIFTIGGTTFLWKSVKKMLSATSSNHVEILALHKAS